MIPVFDNDVGTIETNVYFNNTYKVNTTQNRIAGWVDNRDAVAQSVYFILNIERYKFPIYSWDYGVELVSLIGKDIDTVTTVLPRRIREALLQDNRIVDVTDFEFQRDGKKLLVAFTVNSIYGDIQVEQEVKV